MAKVALSRESGVALDLEAGIWRALEIGGTPDLGTGTSWRMPSTVAKEQDWKAGFIGRLRAVSGPRTTVRYARNSAIMVMTD